MDQWLSLLIAARDHSSLVGYAALHDERGGFDGGVQVYQSTSFSYSKEICYCTLRLPFLGDI